MMRAGMDQSDNGMWAVLGIVLFLALMGACLWGVVS